MTRRRTEPTACESFPPILGRAPRVLVLGSMPGARSLAEQRYYANPQNHFWRFMAGICGLDVTADYEARIDALARCGIALWDVLARCERSGSLDGGIVRETEVPNAIAELLARRRTIRTVALNGGKAAQAFAKHVRPDLTDAVKRRVELIRMPSTSPANASIPVATKRAKWLCLRRRLGVRARSDPEAGRAAGDRGRARGVRGR